MWLLLLLRDLLLLVQRVVCLLLRWVHAARVTGVSLVMLRGSQGAQADLEDIGNPEGAGVGVDRQVRQGDDGGAVLEVTADQESGQSVQDQARGSLDQAALGVALELLLINRTLGPRGLGKVVHDAGAAEDVQPLHLVRRQVGQAADDRTQVLSEG